MFIIWGSTTKIRAVGQGAFYCPRCRKHTGYTHCKLKKYFTLYFIPLFPTEQIDEYIACRECLVTFPPATRDLSPEEIEERQRPWTCSQCQSLNPRSEMRCLKCNARRPGMEGIGLIALADGQQRQGTKIQSPSNPDRSSAAREMSDTTRDLANIMASNKCPQCGVVISLVALRCKVCGCEINNR